MVDTHATIASHEKRATLAARLIFTRRSFLRYSARLPIQRQDIELCCQPWCGQARAAPRVDCLFSVRSVPLWCVSANASHNRLAPNQSPTPNRGPDARTVVSIYAVFRGSGLGKEKCIQASPGDIPWPRLTGGYYLKPRSGPAALFCSGQLSRVRGHDHQ